MKKIKSYKCWYKGCKEHKKEGRLKESELIKRKEDKTTPITSALFVKVLSFVK